jgi:G3E family GTPase
VTAAPPRDAAPVPVAVLTGFLGAGKTTLLNRLVRHSSLARTAVVINEFGTIGIDHLLVEPILGEMLLLASGCLCCASRGDLLPALGDLLRRRKTGEVAFDRIVVETSGLADPGPLLNAALVDPTLWSGLRMETWITLVDATRGVPAMAGFPEAMRQIAIADRIVLSKTDLAGAAGTAESLETLVALNPMAELVDGAELTDDRLPGVLTPRLAAAVARRPLVAGHVHSAGLATIVLHGGTLDPALLQAFVRRAQERFGPGLLRLKGLVALKGDAGRPAVLQAVQHHLHPLHWLDAWPDAERGSRLVVITQHVPAGAVADLWDGFFGPPAIDRPDAQALSQRLEGGAGLFG